MSEMLELTGSERVLEIGTGSGYQAAILAQLAAEVISVERFASLAQEARERLAELGYDNVRVEVGDGSLGWPEDAPYDAIIVTAASPEVPAAARGAVGRGRAAGGARRAALDAAAWCACGAWGGGSSARRRSAWPLCP